MSITKDEAQKWLGKPVALVLVPDEYDDPDDPIGISGVLKEAKDDTLVLESSYEGESDGWLIWKYSEVAAIEDGTSKEWISVSSLLGITIFTPE